MAKAGVIMVNRINKDDQKCLLVIAREAIQKAVNHKSPPVLNLSELSQVLQEKGASFVTLTINQQLRGCIGTLEAYKPLALDVQDRAISAALEDPRFPRVSPDELPRIQIEVSVLTPKKPLSYEGPQDLLKKITPFVDGIVLKDGFYKATFLPQVWEKIPDQKQFLSQLCMKMGASGDLWTRKPLEVYIYQVQEFHE
jgi:AmmeMemoRadiSam system protein A